MDSGEVPENILPGVKALGEFYLNFLKKEKEIDWVFFSPAADMRPEYVQDVIGWEKMI